MGSRFLTESLAFGIQNACRWGSRSIWFSLLLLSFSLLAPATGLAQSEESGYQDYLNYKKDYLLKLQAEGLKKSKDPKETQQAFVKLFEKYVSVETNPINVHDWDKLSQDAEKFLKLKPTEPFSRLAARLLLVKAKRTRNILENCEELGKVSSELKKYSIEARLYSAEAVTESVDEADFRWRDVPKKIYNYHLDRMFEWMSQSKDSPEYLQRLMFEQGFQYINRRFAGRFDMQPEFKKKLDATKDKLSPWLNAMLVAEWHYKQAWKARGDGYASTVDGNGWTKFEKSMKLAAEQGKIAYKLHPERPEAATMMIRIAMASDTDDDERTWFIRAKKAEFDYFVAYERYLFSLTPRWGGSHAAMIDFATMCADTNRYDTRVPFVWKKCVKLLLEDLNYADQNDPLRRAANDRMRQYDILPQLTDVYEKYQAYLRNHDGYSTFDVRYYRAREFCIAFNLRQYKDAYAIYQKYHGDVLHPLVILDGQGPNELLVARVIARNGAAAEEVEYIDEQTHSLAGMDRTAEASQALLERIEEATAKNDLPEAAMYFEVKRKFLRKEVAFHRGKWVNLKFTPDLRYWINFGGRYLVNNPKSIVGWGSSQEQQYIGYATSFPAPYEVEVTVEGGKSYYWHKTMSAGIVSGRMRGPKTGWFFWADTIDKRSGCNSPREDRYSYLIGDHKSVRIKVKVFDGHCEMFDGDEWRSFEDPKFEPGALGLAILPWQYSHGEVQYSDFRVRKLNDSPLPPPPSEDHEARVEYYTKRLETDKSYVAYMALGEGYRALEKYDEALTAFQAAGQLLPEHPRPDIQAGDTYLRQKKKDEATRAFEAGLEKSVGNAHKGLYAIVLNRLVWLYAACPDAKIRDGKKALKHANALWKTQHKRNPLTSYQLAAISAAYAESGKFDDAIKHVQSAIKTAKKSKQGKYAESLEKKCLKLYQDGKPYRDSE